MLKCLKTHPGTRKPPPEKKEIFIQYSTNSFLEMSKNQRTSENSASLEVVIRALASLGRSLYLCTCAYVYPCAVFALFRFVLSSRAVQTKCLSVGG